MKYGLLAYQTMFQSLTYINIGDYIQSLAAKQFLPQVDEYVDREQMHRYCGESIRLIANGWYIHNPTHWPPSNAIDPLYVSFHLSPKCKDKVLQGRGLEHFRKHGPVGCRDKETCNILKDAGVNAYYSSCLTLTLGNTYKRAQEDVGDDIYFVDALYDFPPFNIGNQRGVWRKMRNAFSGLSMQKNRDRILRDLFGDNIYERAQHITQLHPCASLQSEDDCFTIADSLLKKYMKAKLVITSRIHCAIPCMAIGVPVILLGSQLMGSGRVESLSHFFHKVSLDSCGSVIDSNVDLAYDSLMELKNKDLHLPYVEQLNEMCQAFIAGGLPSVTRGKKC